MILASVFKRKIRRCFISNYSLNAGIRRYLYVNIKIFLQNKDDVNISLRDRYNEQLQLLKCINY